MSISRDQLDMLNEVGNIGAGNAATALSILMQQRVDMALPWTKICNIEEGCSLLSSPGQVGVGVQVAIEGTISGTMLLTLEEDSAMHLLLAFGDMLVGRGLDDELARSALSEAGNIVTGSFLTSILNFLNEEAASTPPLFIYDFFDAFVCNVVVEGCGGADKVMVFKTELTVDGKAISGDLAFMPSPETFNIIMGKLQSARGDETRG